ncbi:cation-translocating P-type ATPase [Mycolicibacterium grossiae]|uniref:Haloacid dehalogenase n=1 Tax=Mycolicibacterium grossiae TaxID=1552759 RepID=A0A1E8Q5H5_9MYCO|nr:haloacid dehalogenase [Mycolicibacterium grossiae]QEM45099.1 cation-translocating P-type ATPase [Mycolicibacterium grossiae]
MGLFGLVRSTASLPLRVLDTGVRTTALVATAGVHLVGDTTRAAAAGPASLVNAVTDVVAELFGGESSRRCWQGAERCWIEVRGLDDAAPDGDLARAVRAALEGCRGVDSVSLNHPLSRAVVHTDGTEVLEELCEAVAAAEDRLGARRTDEPIDLPADPIVLASSTTAVGANLVGLAVTVAGRALAWPRFAPGMAAAVAFVDYQPRLRALVEEWLGDSAADTALSLAASIGYTLGQQPTSLGVDLFMHLVRLGETRAGAQAWLDREPDLAGHADADGLVRSRERPVPLPLGPVEKHGDRSGVVQGVGAVGLGVATGGINGAATTALVAAPKAARNSREAFAGTLGRGLAEHHGVLPLNSDALRMLDRVDAVLVDPRALCTDELRVGRIRGVADHRRAEAWQWAQDRLDALGAGWHDVPWAEGRVLIRHANHPLAPALLREVRRSDAAVVSVDVAGLDDLRPAFDDLHAHDGDLDAGLADAVRALQRDGRTVAVVSVDAAQAMADADVAIGVTADGAWWHADLVAADLAGVWRILHALPAARRASERGVQLATGASLLGALLMVPGVRGRGPGPVTVGAGTGGWIGYRMARTVLAAEVPAERPTREWHAMSAEQVRDLLPASDPSDRLRDAPRPSRVHRAARGVAPVRDNLADFASAIREELSDPLTPVLAIGSAASAVLGSPIDAILVGSVLTGNAALAAVQRLRAERLLHRLLAVQDPPARLVLGDDGDDYATADATALRPGDVIEVRPGEVVPADARLVEATDLEVDESSLTGESLPVPKRLAATPAAAVAERACMIHATTTVVAGTAVAIVTAVGGQTEARRAELTPGAQTDAIGLQAQLSELTNKAWPVSLAGGGVVTALSLLRRGNLRQAISSGVAVSVAAVPEGLPLVATLAQQASARRLSGLGALVRSPRSVEALGRVDVVCFDKTGTLSENRLRVTSVDALNGEDRDGVLRAAVRATPRANGDGHEHATDAAVAEAGIDVDGVDVDADAHLPFRSGRPFSASIHGTQLTIKGAPEMLLGATDADATERVAAMAADGLRVLAVATRELTDAQVRDARADADAFDELCRGGLHLIGLLGLADTPRPESAAVLAGLAAHGIEARLITGDHPVTASAIAAELGLPVTLDQVITGNDWEALSRRDQERAVRERIVFARMSPEHKVQIVETLQRLDRVVAMVGDGANDAAAIRAATVGIGVAARGSDPARTAADVMLLDGRIGALLDALDEGRQLWQRVQAAVAVLLGGNAGEVGFAILGTALTGRAPLNTRQLLLVNMLTDALPAAALAVSRPTSSASGAGNGPDERALWRTVGVRGATTAGAATAAWAMAGVTGRPQRASTVALVALVATQLGQTLIDSRSPLVVGTALGSLAALGALVSTPGVSQLLGSTPLGPVGWAQALGTAAGATAIAAVAPRVLARSGSEAAGQSSTSSTPTRQSTAYSSRNGHVNAVVTTSVNGSEPAETATSATLGEAGDRTSNTP